ncbi:HAD family hydrolase [Neotamlana laminarinivorans]|uniref:Cof-type HAD-IIB family hydrolase n=1 Tax=Neotamlana laminarinivorans TaxID=2883124 RepID=A0A9X1L1S2_9FLAO|nr:HAD family hydrolase [Tamlana laminarinivorans]MCB4799033.1 Cof-type HAD-IIB family hydrolase [Tamlana laminarinivorans]
MDLSQVKLVVSDMDGTLLNSNHEVSNLFLEQFKNLKQNNIKFVAASGRPYYSIIDKLETIKNEIIVVAENGGLVIENDKQLLSTPINTNNLYAIEQIIDTNNHIHPVFCTKSKGYFKSNSFGYISVLSEYYPTFKVIDSVDEIEEDIMKIAIYHSEDSEKHIYPLVKHFENNYAIKISGKNWLDISDNLANKGHAIKMLQEKYNISENETMAFGDYNNDLEMLKIANFSFAMQNAHENVKQVANYETKSNDEFGVEYIIDKLLKSKI